MNLSGSYTKGKVIDNYIYKLIKPISDAEVEILKTLNENNEIINYIKDVSKIVKLPIVCEYNKEKQWVKQSYVKGCNVDAFLLKLEPNNEKVYKVFSNLVDVYVNIKKEKNFTIDFNLLNFMVNEQNLSLTFVDVVPPLYIKSLNKIKHNSLLSQKELFLNKPLQLKSFLMYFIGVFINKDTEKVKIEKLYLKLLKILEERQVIEDLNIQYNHIFQHRFNLFKHYLSSNVKNIKSQFNSYDIKNHLINFKG